MRYSWPLNREYRDRLQSKHVQSVRVVYVQFLNPPICDGGLVPRAQGLTVRVSENELARVQCIGIQYSLAPL